MFLLPPSAFASPQGIEESNDSHMRGDSQPDENTEELLSPDKFASSQGVRPITNTVSCGDSGQRPAVSTLPPPSPSRKQQGRSRRGSAASRSRSTASSRERLHSEDSQILVEVNEEMDKLRRENYRLMEENLRKTYYAEISSRPKTSQIDSSPQPLNISNKHVDSLISKQVEEISALKQQLQRNELEQERAVSDIQADLLNRERQHQQEVLEMNTQHSQAIEALKAQHCDAIEELQASAKQIHNDNMEKLRESEQKVESLTVEQRSLITELQQDKEECQRLSQTIQTSQIQIRDLERGRQQQDTLIQQLQSELQSYKQKKVETLQWPRVKVELETKIQAMSTARDHVASENEALNLRLSAINDILAAQQDSLRVDTTDTQKLGTQEKLHRLLNRWRQKVYSLLVQQKSADINTAKARQEWGEEKRLREVQIRNLTNQSRELECRLRDKDAQVKLLTKQKQTLELSTHELGEKLSASEKTNRENQETLPFLYQLLQEMSKSYESQCNELLRAESRLHLYHNRLEAANSVLNKLQKRVSSLSQTTSAYETLKERYSDSELVRSDMQGKITSLESTLLSQASEIEKKQEKIIALSDRHDILTSHSHIETKRIELETERSYKDKISEYEFTISDLRKELAKTIVTLRQLERRHADMDLQHAEQVRSVTSHGQEVIHQLEEELRTTQRDRNLLHSNLSHLTERKGSHREPAKVSIGVSNEATPLKSSNGTSSCSPDSDHKSSHTPGRLNLADAVDQSVIGSIQKLAASVLLSDSDDDTALTHQDENKENCT